MVCASSLDILGHGSGLEAGQNKCFFLKWGPLSRQALKLVCETDARPVYLLQAKYAKQYGSSVEPLGRLSEETLSRPYTPQYDESTSPVSEQAEHITSTASQNVGEDADVGEDVPRRPSGGSDAQTMTNSISSMLSKFQAAAAPERDGRDQQPANVIAEPGSMSQTAIAGEGGANEGAERRPSRAAVANDTEQEEAGEDIDEPAKRLVPTPRKPSVVTVDNDFKYRSVLTCHIRTRTHPSKPTASRCRTLVQNL
jgi:hypothetical protein